MHNLSEAKKKYNLVTDIKSLFLICLSNCQYMINIFYYT